MEPCLHCQSTIIVKIGRNRSGSQRFRCRTCGRRFTPQPRPRGYPAELHQRAVQLYLEGTNLRRIGRLLSVDHHTVINWLAAHAAQLPPAPVPATSETAELDELFTFVEKKKPSPTS